MAAPSKLYQSIWGWIDVVKRIQNWNESPYSWKIAYSFRRIKKAINEETEDIQDFFLETFFDPVLGSVATLAIDLSLMMLAGLEGEMKGYIDGLSNKMSTESIAQLNKLINKGKKDKKLEFEDYQAALPVLREWFIKTPEGQLFSTLMDQQINFMQDDGNGKPNDLDIILGRLLAVLQSRASYMDEPYFLLDKKPKPLQPRSGKTLDPIVQPRMPWHDMQVQIEGPSVYDVSRNFIDRWNAGQMFLERAAKAPDTQYNAVVDHFVNALLKFIEFVFAQVNEFGNLPIRFIGMLLEHKFNDKAKQLGEELKTAQPKPYYIKAPKFLPKPPRDRGNKGDAYVQIIRSAAVNLMHYEQQGRDSSGIYLPPYMTSDTLLKTPNNTPKTANDMLDPSKMAQKTGQYDPFTEYTTVQNIEQTVKQNDCEQAWVKAIQASQNYIYIESQYFQSDFGTPEGYKNNLIDTYNDKSIGQVSGPMSSLVYFDEDVLPYIEYIGGSEAIATVDINAIDSPKIMEVIDGLLGRKADPVTGKIEKARPRLLIKLKQQLSTVWTMQFSGKITKQIFKTHEDIAKPQKNQVMKAIATRIEKAIACNETYHTYIVMPVHPEGMLNDPSIMHGIHMAMQTLYSGQNSLIKRIQIAMQIKELRSQNPSLNKEQARLQAITPSSEANDSPYATQDWSKYLTVLNLRSWETLSSAWRGDRHVTEQIYVHSKLLIVDDRIAIVGSCNVNDRSMQGDRDSEIAAIIHGQTPKMVKLDGEHEAQVSELVHNFRVKIWRKLFALDIKHSFIDPATSLSGEVLTQPAAPSTVQKIQERANKNLETYTKVFPFVPQNTSPVQASQGKAQPDRGKLPKTIKGITYYPLGCSIWPLWVYNDPDDHSKGGKLADQMPFQQSFWDAQITQHEAPRGIEGFITAMPVEWTI